MGTVQAIVALSNLISVALEALSAANQATVVLRQAQAEGWQEGDPRWNQAFSDLDIALEKARARLT